MQSEKSLDVDRSTTLATVSLGLQRASSQALIDSGNRVVQKWRTEIKDGENARNTLVQQLKTLEGKNSELTVKLIQTESITTSCSIFLLLTPTTENFTEP